MGQPSATTPCGKDLLPRSPPVEGLLPPRLGEWSAGSFHLSASWDGLALESSPKVMPFLIR